MVGPDPVRVSVEALGAYFVGDVTIAEALTKVCDVALEVIRPATRAGISMTVDGRAGTYVFTHPDVQEVDQPQYDTGDGPCIDAFRTGRVVFIDSTTDHGPYPIFRVVAAQHGLMSTMSVPMATPTQIVGALNLYSPEPHAFSEEAAAAFEPFATHAAYLLLNHQAYWDARSLSENLERALESRAEIEQAKGIIMASTGCTPDEAFDQLRAQSQRENVKVRDLATELVHRQRRRHRAP